MFPSYLQDINEEMDGWGDSDNADDDNEIDSTKADPFIYDANDSSQVAVVPSAMKEIKLPGVGKKGGCGDWQIKTSKAKDEDGTPKFILESKSGSASARYLDSVLNSRFAQALSEESKSEMTRPVCKTKQFTNFKFDWLQ
jgi:hypothetical protein